MRASQDQCIHAFIGQRGQIPPGGRERSLIVRLDPSVFHKGDKQGAGDGYHHRIGPDFQNPSLERGGPDGRRRPQNPDAPCFRRGYGGVGGGFHHPHGGDRQFPEDMGRDRADRAARGDDQLDALRQQETAVLPGYIFRSSRGCGYRRGPGRYPQNTRCPPREGSTAAAGRPSGRPTPNQKRRWAGCPSPFLLCAPCTLKSYHTMFFPPAQERRAIPPTICGGFAKQSIQERPGQREPRGRTPRGRYRQEVLTAKLEKSAFRFREGTFSERRLPLSGSDRSSNCPLTESPSVLTPSSVTRRRPRRRGARRRARRRFPFQGRFPGFPRDRRRRSGRTSSSRYSPHPTSWSYP